ncbi:MAG TPA: TAXI family TRAP transporter solute-binding subunit [Pseudorhodoferax sp.]|nr:TAXI family TRAP transporter solute-binding subunit [Pseudorhodoferax sp.]
MSNPSADSGRLRAVLGTATPGGGFPLYGDALVATIHAVDPSLEIVARNTKGSTENVPLLDAGELDIALVQGEVASPALARPDSALRIVAAMYSSPGMFAVRPDSPCRRIADLRGKTIALGARGSGLTILGRSVLAAVGIDPDRDIEAIYLDRAGDGPGMVQDGRVAALWGAGIGWPGFTTLAESAEGARFIVPDAADIPRILASNAAIKALEIPAQAYRGIAAPLRSVGSWSFVLARGDLPEELGWRIASALHRGESAIAARLAQARETTAANTVAAMPSRQLLHPGVARYLQEAGLLA